MQEFFDFLGIKFPILVAGLAGGVLRALSRRRYKLREMIASPICGLLAASYLTEATVHYIRWVGLPVPPPHLDQETTYATAFLLGVVAMWIADIAGNVLARWYKQASDD